MRSRHGSNQVKDLCTRGGARPVGAKWRFRRKGSTFEAGDVTPLWA